jgi:sulfur-carrier protein
LAFSIEEEVAESKCGEDVRFAIGKYAPSMAKVFFTPNIQRHVFCREAQSAGGTVREVLDGVFAANPEARSYILDNQSTLRKCITVFVDGDLVSDRVHLSDAVSETSSIYVFQALSGG